jgi:tRNA dimethylallyltransferase
MSENAGGFNGQQQGGRQMGANGRIGAWLAAVPPDRPVLIAGPTASGKSALALALATAQRRTVVNADALQVYARWRILTARPSPQDEAAAPHRLYGHVAHDAAWSAGDWLRAVAALLREDPRPVIVGGTGLYFTALTGGLAEIPPVPAEVRAEAAAILSRQGLEALVAGLDPATHARIDRANPARVLRAWEVLRATGRGLADWQAATGAPVLAVGDAWPLVLAPDPARLAARIARRFEAMLAGGALEEAAAERARWDPARPSARAIGAAELMAHLDGQMTREAAVTAAVVATRQYAKRQRSWFRNRMGDWPALDPG